MFFHKKKNQINYMNNKNQWTSTSLLYIRKCNLQNRKVIYSQFIKSSMTILTHICIRTENMTYSTINQARYLIHRWWPRALFHPQQHKMFVIVSHACSWPWNYLIYLIKKMKWRVCGYKTPNLWPKVLWCWG